MCRYMDLSAADTVYALLLGRKYKQAETVKKDLRLSDKKWVVVPTVGLHTTALLWLWRLLDTSVLSLQIHIQTHKH